MTSARRPGLALFLGLGALATGLPAAHASMSVPDLVGRWTTLGGDTVEFSACGEGAVKATLCGRLVALRDGDSPRRDVRNPAAARRTHPILGLELVRGLREASPGVWTGGELYNPDDGRTYRGTIRMLGRNSLELRGCALVVVCQSQTWRRASL